MSNKSFMQRMQSVRVTQQTGVERVHGDFHDALLGCELAIMDHPSTTWLMAMAANVPTLCVWDPTLWQMTDESASMMDRLAKAGLYARTPEELRLIFETLPSDVAMWWNRSDNQQLRQSFLTAYARNNRHWLPIWWQALSRL